MTRFKAILFATILTLAVSTSAFAGDITGRSGDITGKSTTTSSGDITGRRGDITGKSAGDITGVYGAFLDVLSMVF